MLEAVEQLGGIYVKLAQFVALRTPGLLIGEKMRLLAFYDAVNSDEKINIGHILKSELPSNKIEQIAKFETTPFAAGSIGQVFKGYLNDGTKIIIKIKSPGFRRKIRADFMLLSLIVTIYDLLYQPKSVNLPGLFKEFKRTTISELDYKKEVQNANYFYQEYEHHKTVKIPKTYADLSTNNIIIQEYVEGISTYRGNTPETQIKRGL